MGRPARKKNKAEAAARKLGELEAETKFWDKQPLTKKLKRLMWKKIEQVDPIEIAGIAATTYIVYGIIKNSVVLADLVTKNLPTPHMLHYSADIAEQAFSKEIVEQIKEAGDLPILVVSFALSVLIVKHGGEIFGMLMDGGKTVGTLVTAFLAA